MRHQNDTNLLNYVSKTKVGKVRKSQQNIFFGMYAIFISQKKQNMDDRVNIDGFPNSPILNKTVQLRLILI